MAILSGKRLGPYEILSAIGAGGMGEVYRARDTRLERIVAVKILPDHLSDRAELRERFEREARTVASLNHPHICTLYDVGHEDGTDFLVMEYLEGETLADRLKKGPLPLDQVLQYAIEISDALDKAHRKGITHRDLKPGNVMLTKSGAKLLDFGLAKLRGQQTAAANLSALPTGNNLTAQGTILGTLQYMAPEQLEGKEADARTDIFAFGVVVYEMATGKKAFEGKTQASLIAKILETDPPPMSSLQPMTPPSLDRVVKKCLAKEPERRWQAASDVCDELKWIGEESVPRTMPSATAAISARIGRRWLVVSALACVFAVAVAGITVWILRSKPSPAPQPVTRTVIALPAGDRLAGPDEPALALSPDGKYLVYVALRGGTRQLYLRAMDSEEVRPISNTEGAIAPFFSPDGQWLGFFAGGKLKKISIGGGAALTLTDGAAPLGATWGSQGKIIFQPSAGPLLEVSDAGSTSQQVTRTEKGETTHAWPTFLPDGKTFLFGMASGKILVQSGTGQHRDLTQATVPLGGPPQYSPSGHLLYVQAGTLMAVPFDAQRLEIKGAAVPVVEGVTQSTNTGATQWSISTTGTLVYVSGGTSATQRRIVWVSRDGAEQQLPAPAQDYQYVRLSPDGRRAAVELDNQIWLYDLSRDTLTRFTFEGSANQSPTWTPDGKRIAFYSNKEGVANLYWQLADGSGGLERLTTSEYGHIPKSFSPDGQLLAFHENNPKTGKDIWVLRLSDRKIEPFLRTPFIEGAPTFSPDGHWLSYVSNESGRPEVYVQPYPGPGGKWQISTDGGTEPAWNRNGRELFYRSGDKMMALDVTTQPGFSAGKSHLLFEGKYFTSDFPLVGTAYDVSADGQHFLMVKDMDAEAVTQINVVLNWFEELKQKVPTGKK